MKLRSILRSRHLHLLFAGLCLSLLCLNCAAQSDILKPGTDTTLIKRLILEARQKQNPDSVLSSLNEPLKLSIAGNYTSGILLTFRLISFNYFLKNEYSQSVLALKNALPFCRKPTQKAILEHTIGNVYSQTGDYVKASENFYLALADLQNCPATDNEAANTYIDIYTSLAILSSELKHDSSELAYLIKAEDLARKTRSNFKLKIVLMNKSTYYQEREKFDTAIMILKETQQLCKENNFKNAEADIDEGLAGIYLSSGQYQKAIEHFKAAINLTKDPSIERHNYILVYSSYGIAKALYKMKKYRQAETILVQTIKQADSLHVKKCITDAYQTLVNVYRATGQYHKALDCMDSLVAEKDSLTGIEKTTAINQIEVKYKTAEKDKQLSENQLLLSQNQLMIAKQKDKINQKNILMLSVGGGLLLLLVISTGIYLQAINKQRSLEKENKISILKAVVTGGDNERSRIARELHDGVGGMLSAAMMRFSSMHHEEPAIAQTTAYKDAMGILREMGDEIRKTAHNLMPEVLLKQSLPEAVRIFCNNVQQGGTLKIDFQSFGTFDGLSQGRKLNMYRITQELIKNAVTHAKAHRLLVQLLQNADKLIISVEDNGIGFDRNKMTGGLGLHNVRTRVSSLDGHFILESEPGKGTTAIVEFENNIHQVDGGTTPAD